MTRIANKLFWEQGLYDNVLEKCPYPVGESLHKALQLKAAPVTAPARQALIRHQRRLLEVWVDAKLNFH